MVLNERQKKFIDNALSEIDESYEISEKHAIVIDECLDEEIFNLEDDEDGDKFEEYSNLVWDYIEEKDL